MHLKKQRPVPADEPLSIINTPGSIIDEPINNLIHSTWQTKRIARKYQLSIERAKLVSELSGLGRIAA